MSFPTPWTVQREAWSSGGLDAHGNQSDTYLAPVDVAVYGWAAPAPEERTSERVVIDLRMYAPSGTAANSRDRFILPDGTYEAQGPAQSYDYGPFGWQPGVVINLRRVEG